MARQRWGRRIEFFLTSLGFSVGVGDLWRFPYLVMKNGGGAFLIPIVIFNVVGAIPIVYLEMIMGQYSQSGAVSVWSVCPLLKGVGYGTIIATFIFSIYYGVMIGWMLYYFIHSFFNPLPWATCDNDWNRETCVVNREDVLDAATTTTVSAANLTSISTTVASTVSTVMSTANSTLYNMSSTMPSTDTGLRYQTAAEEFWKYHAVFQSAAFLMLILAAVSLFSRSCVEGLQSNRYRTHRISDGLEDLGAVNWALFGCLLAINVVCFLCIFKGVKLTGKVVYFTVIGPFVLLAVFLIRGAILPGADKGILFYLTPKPEKLLDTKIWAEACMQVFVSIGPGFGAMITFASYNKFTNNCMRDAILVCLMDLFSGFFGGFVIFSVIGHVSHRTGIPIEHFNQSGYGLGFIMYPEAANYLPPPQLWCALFFFMSIFLGIDSQFPNYEIVITALKDEFPKWLEKRGILLSLVVIVAAFLLGIPQVTQGGIYLLTLVDWYAATFSVAIFALLEILVMTYVYGIKRVDENMKEMTGRTVPLVFKACWCVLTPLLLAVTIGFAIFTYAPPAYEGYVYPDWAVTMGWMVAASSLTPVPLYMIYRLYRTPGPLLERFKINLKPTDKWGPPKKYAIDDEKEMSDDVKKNGPEVWAIKDPDKSGIENKGFQDSNEKAPFPDPIRL